MFYYFQNLKKYIEYSIVKLLQKYQTFIWKIKYFINKKRLKIMKKSPLPYTVFFKLIVFLNKM